MKVIELLSKIANGEEIPAKLKIKKWEYNGKNENLKYELFDRLFEEDFELNDEVEIIEEEKKIPEKLNNTICKDMGVSISVEPSMEELKNKINEIIDYLKSKGE